MRAQLRLLARYACRRWTVAPALAMAAMLVTASPARADTLFGANLGYFAIRAEDARTGGDVLTRNLGFLLFDLSDFNGFTFGGEYLVGLGNFIEVGAGAGYYQRTVPSIYADFVNIDGSEIEQDLKLRIMPVTFTARVFPAGRRGAFQPYVGGGVAILAWRYSESGEFVDFNNRNEIFRDSFVDSGNEAAPVVFGGVRFPLGDVFLLGGEFRWQGGQATLDESKGFAGDRIDLGGYTTQMVFQIRF